MLESYFLISTDSIACQCVPLNTSVLPIVDGYFPLIISNNEFHEDCFWFFPPCNFFSDKTDFKFTVFPTLHSLFYREKIFTKLI